MNTYAILALVSASVIASLIRFRLTTALDKENFPLGTLIANVSACFIAALCLFLGQVYITRHADKFVYFNFMLFTLSAGVLSTYSSFAYQLASMFIKKKIRELIRYASYTIALSIVAFYLGTLLASKII